VNLEAFVEALQLLARRDRELLDITVNSLSFAFASTALAAVGGVPVGVLLAFRRFPGKQTIVSAVQTLVGLPTVIVGLLVFGLLSRGGPLGSLGLLFTPAAVIIGQAILAFPIIVSFVSAGLAHLDTALEETLLTLGASRFRRTFKIIREGRIAVASAVLTGFGRVIGEVGVAMMLGGNIRWYTRTITTAIALETQKGAFAMSVALGVVLIVVAFGVNFGLSHLIRFRPVSRTP
jgi:tungstate transport system permease protein